MYRYQLEGESLRPQRRQAQEEAEEAEEGASQAAMPPRSADKMSPSLRHRGEVQQAAQFIKHTRGDPNRRDSFLHLQRRRESWVTVTVTVNTPPCGAKCSKCSGTTANTQVSSARVPIVTQHDPGQWFVKFTQQVRSEVSGPRTSSLEPDQSKCRLAAIRGSSVYNYADT